jgi:hypothetical protein
VSTDARLQREITRVALEVLAESSFALAGSGAIREHGIVDRETHDVDLFTNDLSPDVFDEAANRLIRELGQRGWGVEQIRRAPQFAQLEIRVDDDRTVDVDLAVDWREREPVILDVGPVLNLKDAVGSKISALYSRAEARDFLDADSIRRSRRFTDEELMEAAAERDAGFELPMFAQQLDLAQRLRLERVERYGVDEEGLRLIKHRFAQWSDDLRSKWADVSNTKRADDTP